MLSIEVQSKFSFVFESYGVAVGFESNSQELLELGRSIAAKALVGRLSEIGSETKPPQSVFRFLYDEEGQMFFEDNGKRGLATPLVTVFARMLSSSLRIVIAEKAYPWVFIHAGSVSRHGKAIIFPAWSYQGKTTLVSELIRIGADYMSDEYAVLDEIGMVHPFERDLSIRVDERLPPVEMEAAAFGSGPMPEPVPLGMVVLTKYEPDSVWDPEILSVGQGILETVPQVIPINFNTKFALKVLNTTFNRAIIVKSPRGDARVAAKTILNFFDNSLDLGKIP